VLRCLPPAGHPIRLRSILGAFFGAAGPPERFLPCAGYPDSLLTASGTAALTLALTALRELGRGDEVVMPAYTCPSVAAAAIKSGLKPILCDLGRNSFEMDREQLRSCIGARTLAVIAVHLFGIPENMTELRRLADRNEAILIEDATQAFGNGAQAAGDIVIFSFGRGKPLTLFHGGAIVVNDPELDALIRKVVSELPPRHAIPSRALYLLTLTAYSFLFHPRLYWIPSRLPWLGLGETRFSLEIDLAGVDSAMMRLGNSLHSSFQGIRANRLALARRYHAALSGLDGCMLPHDETQAGEIALLRFPLLVPDRAVRDRILSTSRRQGLGLTGMYPAPLHRIHGLDKHLARDLSYPAAEEIADRLLTLPLHEHVGASDISRMRRLISDAL
jgi:dTDP-4-amino-4,6-dideoxygalactose transaminase